MEEGMKKRQDMKSRFFIRRRINAWGKLRTVWPLQRTAALIGAGILFAAAPMTVCAEEMPARTANEEAAGITAESRAIAAYTEDYTMGTVASLCNGVTFQNSIYAGNYDSIVVSAYPNSGYSFAYFTDNGVIVTKSAYYAFNPGYYDHTVVAHFVKRGDNDDDDVPRVNWSNSACVYAPGYKIDAVSITTDQVVQGKLCREAFDSVLGDYHYIGMYNISFAHAGKPLEKLDGSVQLLFDIPAQYQKAGRSFRMLRVYKGQPAVLEDLSERGNKVQFETDCTAAYALVYKDW